MKVYQAVTTAALGFVLAGGAALPARASSPTAPAPAALASALVATNVAAAVSDLRAGSGVVPAAPGKLECVPYARVTSGIQIYGDAHTWWGQARGRYATGNRPQVGAVMAIRPFNNSRLGHVATVSRLVDSRTILLSHANWSVPGGIERNVTALDVSPENDWSHVRIWYAPSHGLGTTHWPVAGFIYNAKPGSGLAAASTGLGTPRPAAAAAAPSRRHRDPIGAIIAGKY